MEQAGPSAQPANRSGRSYSLKIPRGIPPFDRPGPRCVDLNWCIHDISGLDYRFHSGCIDPGWDSTGLLSVCLLSGRSAAWPSARCVELWAACWVVQARRSLHRGCRRHSIPGDCAVGYGSGGCPRFAARQSISESGAGLSRPDGGSDLWPVRGSAVCYGVHSCNRGVLPGYGVVDIIQITEVFLRCPPCEHLSNTLEALRPCVAGIESVRTGISGLDAFKQEVDVFLAGACPPDMAI